MRDQKKMTDLSSQEAASKTGFKKHFSLYKTVR